MHRAVPLTLLMCMTWFSGVRDASAEELNYTLYLLAIPLADATFSLDVNASSYRMVFRFHTTGLADIVAGDRLDEHVTGRFENDRPVPIEYGSASRLRGQDRMVGLVWRDGNPTVTAIVPPNSAEREEVPPELRLHTMDPLSAIVLMIRRVVETGRCDSSARSYDGRRLSVFEAKTVQDEDIPASSRSIFAGRAMRCDFVERTLAGFHLGSGREEDAKDRPGKLWLARLTPGGPLVPVRAAVETRWFGEATVNLTSATP